MTTYGVRGLPRRDSTKDFDDAQRYRDLLTAVNGRAVLNGWFLVPMNEEIPLEQSALPSGPPGTIDLAITPGDYEELLGYASQVGLDITQF
jgi:hypothetical protein